LFELPKRKPNRLCVLEKWRIKESLSATSERGETSWRINSTQSLSSAAIPLASLTLLSTESLVSSPSLQRKLSRRRQRLFCARYININFRHEAGGRGGRGGGNKLCQAIFVCVASAPENYHGNAWPGLMEGKTNLPANCNCIKPVPLCIQTRAELSLNMLFPRKHANNPSRNMRNENGCEP
jgi:hypothetical protein